MNTLIIQNTEGCQSEAPFRYLYFFKYLNFIFSTNIAIIRILVMWHLIFYTSL